MDRCPALDKTEYDLNHPWLIEGGFLDKICGIGDVLWKRKRKYIVSFR